VVHLHRLLSKSYFSRSVCLYTGQEFLRESTHFKQPEVVYIFAGRLKPEIVDPVKIVRICFGRKDESR
jgi:hypothetical protein